MKKWFEGKVDQELVGKYIDLLSERDEKAEAKLAEAHHDLALEMVRSSELGIRGAQDRAEVERLRELLRAARRNINGCRLADNIDAALRGGQE